MAKSSSVFMEAVATMVVLDRFGHEELKFC